MLFIRKKKKLDEKVEKKINPTTQNTINFEKLDEDGAMHIKDNWYSKTYKLGDIEYTTAKHDDKIKIIESYAGALNLLEGGSVYQLTVVNKKIADEKLNNVKYELQNDSYDEYRKEYNSLIEKRFKHSEKAFEIEKYVTIGLEGLDKEHSKRQIQDVSKDLIKYFNEHEISLTELSGQERLALFNEIINKEYNFPFNYEDINNSGVGEKSFIAPSRIEIKSNHLLINETFAKTIYIRHFPKVLGDNLIKNLTNLSFELIVSINTELYPVDTLYKELEEVETDASVSLIKAQQDVSSKGEYISEKFVGGDKDKKDLEVTEQWRDEIVNNDQKIFKGFIAVYITADSLEELRDREDKVRRAGNSLGVKFEDIYYYQEDAFNTILPIGYNFLELKQHFSRRMTTSNIATQVPFTQVDIISNSNKAMYYGQNQLSSNMITIDRKRDLMTGSGVIIGMSGSGKSMAVKINEIIPNKLRYPDDEIIIVDPENEYGDIGTKFNAQVIDISIGSDTYINILDLPDFEKLDEEERKVVVKNKVDLLTTFFGSVVKLNNDYKTLIDRTTTQTYKFYNNPTLKEWHNVLLNQPEAEAHKLALKIEVYTIGSQSIFSNSTNVNLNNKFIIFNLNKLSSNLKSLVLAVIQDFIWNRVVRNRRLLTTWIYFDELQLYFRTKEQSEFFMELWSRVRKYGAIPTGITQNVETISIIEEGRKLLSNTEFMIILKQKNTDVTEWEKIIYLTDEQKKYILSPRATGTGLIYAGGVIVPFENPIPKESKLFKLVETDAY